METLIVLSPQLIQLLQLVTPLVGSLAVHSSATDDRHDWARTAVTVLAAIAVAAICLLVEGEPVTVATLVDGMLQAFAVSGLSYLMIWKRVEISGIKGSNNLVLPSFGYGRKVADRAGSAGSNYRKETGI